ncbi:hypothetical protein EXU57_15150 [Segetibacter sp. 3557_3]|uniref:WD40/YVTN/BNR-like repeat-containing protein n=1 Tax=Segetibacter sp. 3557_3 TaxID=2547429 RepID=UPI001059008A|nr:hypothetical protein [Segetibacter sp. 3557_3]TDH24154.1 hypothetical protein EXU57_15150 [Segetibacter sp. 3557_3]
MKKLLFLLLLTRIATAQNIPQELLQHFTYRNIGPFRTGAWITGFAVPETPLHDHLYTYYVGTRNGGVWKTVNNGTTFESIFPYHHTIGAVAVAPSNPAHVWVGTGESYIARSSYSGDGVYVSTDTGKTFTHMGLKETQHIIRILVHPRDPKTVYVASPGHLFSSNAERGVFKTGDGGKSWKKVLYFSDTVGVIDLVMHPTNPDILYAASYDKKRTAWAMESGGPQSALHQTTDGGKTWKKLANGLPSGNIGRIGIDICKAHPETMYAVYENLNLKPGATNPNETIGGEVYRTDDSGKSWRKMNKPTDDLGGKAAYSFNQITVHPTNRDWIFVTGVALSNSRDGGKTWRDISYRDRFFFPESFGDVRTFWIDKSDPEHMLFGSDGGVHVSYDGGKTNAFHYNIPLGEVYALGVDMDEPYNVYAGLQDHESWKGPSNGWSGSVTLENWVTVGSDDGMYNVIDPTDSRWAYNSGQFGLMWRVDQKSGIRQSIQPRATEGAPRYRFNWVTPLLLAPSNPKTIYTGAQMLLRSKDQGSTWEAISPDLTTNDLAKTTPKGNVQYCTISTIAESPLKPGEIWVGTDDGKVWLTSDDGKNWSDLTTAIAGAGGPASKWVSRVVASAHTPGTAYVAKSGFRDDDFTAYLYKTTDWGKTWKAIKNGLPAKPLNVIVESPANKNLLFSGNDIGVYVSVDGGENWQVLRGNMPIVPVHDLQVHPREKDLVVGTYGRGIWTADISFLEEVNTAMLAKAAHLFNIEPKYAWVPRTFGGNYQLYGNKTIEVPNEPNGLTINFYTKENRSDSVKITISGADGKVVHQRNVKALKGLNTTVWPFPMASRGGFGGGGGAPFQPGKLTVALDIAGQQLSTSTEYKGVRGWPVGY